MLYRIGENNNMVFDGDLEAFLIENSVAPEHIKKMKAKKLQPSKQEYYKPSGERQTVLVPLNKVIGVNRGQVGESVYDNIRSIPNGARKPGSFEYFFVLLKETSLENMFKYYQEEIEPVQMEYYAEDDEYYLIGDGNHRTLSSMIMGAEYIIAKVSIMHCDYEMKKKFIATQNFLEKFNIVDIYDHFNGIAITFKDGNELYEVTGFPMIRDEDCFEYIDKLSREIQSDLKTVKMWKKFPTAVISIIERLHSSTRLIQYIDKRTPKDAYRQSIYLYKLPKNKYRGR